jgi:hypothetical protein
MMMLPLVDDPPGKDTGLLLLVVTQGIGLNVHGFTTIGFLGKGRAGEHTERCDQKPKGQRGFHKARILR